MKHLLNILLIVSSVASIAIAFFISVKPIAMSAVSASQVEPTLALALPPLNPNPSPQPQGSGIARRLQLKTSLPEQPDDKVFEYVVQKGDSPWSIAQKFNLKPETILWSNSQLNAAAGSLKAGDALLILPVNGVLHIVQDGDTLEKLQTMHGTPAREIFEYTGNGFDLTQPPQLTKGQQIIVPNGVGPILWWEAQAPVVAQTASNGKYSGKAQNLGTGYFIWPVNSKYLTQEFWSGHLGIDINTDFRQPVFASDSGTVIFSGWDKTGYGNFIVIDHGNGYKTTYGHNEANLVSTGEVVIKGQQIAESGTTGNSTGNHLDFRIIFNGTFLNPMSFLP